MRKKPTGIVALVVAVAIMIGTGYWLSAPYLDGLQERRKCRAFRDRLLSEIEAADRIDIVEHSWFHDLRDPDGSPIVSDIEEYRRMSLSAAQRAELARIVRGVDAIPNDILLLSIHEPHHSIELYRHGTETSRVLLAFATYNLKWYGMNPRKWDLRDGIEPKELLPRLARWIKTLGFRPVADWQKLAEQVGAPQPATRPESKSE